MAGTKLSNLSAVTNLQTTDDLLIARNATSYRVQAGRFFEALSGVKSADNATQNGVPVLKTTINVTNGTKLMFYSLSADTGLNTTLAGDVIKITIPNNGIDTDKIQNSAVSSVKIADGAVISSKIATGAVTPDKISNTRYATSTKTDTQTILQNTRTMVNGLSATVTPTSTSSVVLVNGYISIGAQHAGYNIVRRVDGVLPASGVYVAQGVASGQFEATQHCSGRVPDDRSCPAYPINFIDAPNTTSSVTYAIQIYSNVNTDAFVNRAYSENNTGSFRTTSHLAAVVLP